LSFVVFFCLEEERSKYVLNDFALYLF